ncbi:MAG: MipA/OmpV family protein [Deltaproteobacteria bacterium]|jgi:outer membrane protein
MKKKWTVMTWLVGAIILSVSFTGEVQAQDTALSIEHLPRVVGAAVAMIPDYEGSDDYTVGAAPFARYNFQGQERYLMLKGYELQCNLLDHPWLRLGPSLNYRFGRDDDVDDDVIEEMEEIDGTGEGGGFLGVELVDSANPRKRFLASVDFLTDLGGEHDGSSVYVSARFWYPLSKTFDFGMGVSTTYASDGYMSTYFGVTQVDADRTGLRVYEADGGFKDIRVFPALVMHLSETWHLALGVQYRGLLGDAEDSPVVDDRGSSSQWLSGVGVAYSW